MRAQSFDSQWDASSLAELNRNLGRCPEEALQSVRKSNRKWAALFRDKIRRNTPRLSAKSARKQGKKHDTRRGSLMRAVTSRGSMRDASIVARGLGPDGKRSAVAPHFKVMEFGGGVMWSSTKSNKSHRIRVLRRSPTMKSLGLFDRGGKQRGASGWFFYPTLRAHEDEYRSEALRGIEDAVRKSLPRRID